MTDSMNLSQTVPNLTKPTEKTESENISPVNPQQSDWKQERARQWWGIKVWERAAMVTKLNKQNGIVHRLARKQQDGTLGQETEEPEDSGNEDLGTHIGDSTSTHHHYPHPAQTAQPTIGSSILSKIAVAGIAATGLGLPIGGALALPSLLDALNGTPAQITPVKPTKPTTDNDTLFELRGRE